MLTNTRITVAVLILAVTGCLFSQEVGRRPGTGSGTTGAIDPNTSQISTNGNKVSIRDGAMVTNLNLKATSTFYGPVVVSNANPSVDIWNTSGILNEKAWRFWTSGDDLFLSIVGDNGTAVSPVLIQFMRDGLNRAPILIYGSEVDFDSTIFGLGGASFSFGVTNSTLVPGRVMIVGADKQESSSSVTDAQLVSLLSGGSTDYIAFVHGTGIGTSFIGPITNTSAFLNGANNAAGAFIFQNLTNAIDKTWVIKGPDYHTASNLWTALRGTSSSSVTELHIGGGQGSDISPESIYFYTGLRGISNNAAAWRFNKVVNNPKFLPIVDNLNDFGDSSVFMRDIYMKGKLVTANGSFGIFYDGGTGSPENVVTGDKGSVFISNNGFYLKTLDTIASDSSRGWQLIFGVGAALSGFVEKTNSQAHALYLTDQITFQSGISQTNATANSTNYFGAATNNFLGKVSIGTNDPTEKLEVLGNIYANGLIKAKAGLSTAQVKGGGTRFDYYTDSSVGGAETDIYSSSTDASILGANGDKLVATYAGNFVTVGTELTQLKVYFGGTAIWDSTGIAVATGTSSWEVNAKIIRASSTVVRFSVTLNTTGASGFVYATSGELTGLTLSSANVLKITGTSSGVGSAVGDIVGKMGTVQWESAQ